MDTGFVIVVLLVLAVMLGATGYFFVRETGWDNARLWLTGPRHMRRLFTPAASEETGIRATPYGGRVEPLPQEQMPMRMLNEAALLELREELQGELNRAAGLTREFDRRLTRMEADVQAARELPRQVDQTVHEVEIRTRKSLTRIQKRLQTSRIADSPYGQRRADALAELYGHLAQVEAALAAVVNPMLLPGEPLSVPEEFFDDTLEWSNWGDVGERAYSFGDAFNQTRIVLEPALADRIEAFIATFREALTNRVYPVVQGETRSPAHLAQMRAGLTNVVETLGPLRREIEVAYRAAALALDDDDDDEDD